MRRLVCQSASGKCVLTALDLSSSRHDDFFPAVLELKVGLLTSELYPHVFSFYFEAGSHKLLRLAWALQPSCLILSGWEIFGEVVTPSTKVEILRFLR